MADNRTGRKAAADALKRALRLSWSWPWTNVDARVEEKARSIAGSQERPEDQARKKQAVGRDAE